MGPTDLRRRARRPVFIRLLALAGLCLAMLVPASGYVWSKRVHAGTERRAKALAPPRSAEPIERSPDGHSGSFSLLTYNVSGLPDLLASGRPSANIPHIAERLNGYDLALVQEDFSHHALLERGASHRHASVPQARARRLFNDGLNRFSRFPFVPLTREGWHQCSGLLREGRDCLSSKGFSVGETMLSDAVSIHVYNHDADAGHGERDQATRAAQFEQLADYILTESASEAVIVAGDTHLDPASPADAEVLARFLARTGLRDACEALLCEAPVAARVLYRSGERVSLAPLRWELPGEFGTTAPALSDHRAVHVRFAFERQEPAAQAALIE